MSGRGFYLEQYKEKILAMHAQGSTQAAIAKELKCSQASVAFYLESQGVKGRNYGYFDDLTQHQHAVLMGTLLGDGHLDLKSRGKNPLLEWSHGPLQSDYMMWKANQFGSLFNKRPPTTYTKRDGNVMVKMSSRCHPTLLKYYHMFYSRDEKDCTDHILKKMITPAILDEVTPEVLAIWWADDGSVERFNGNRGKRDVLLLCLGGLTEKEYVLVESFFNDNGWAVTRKRWWDSSNNSITLRFPADKSEILAAEIEPYMPECIRPKLGGLATKIVRE